MFTAIICESFVSLPSQPETLQIRTMYQHKHGRVFFVSVLRFAYFVIKRKKNMSFVIYHGRTSRVNRQQVMVGRVMALS